MFVGDVLMVVIDVGVMFWCNCDYIVVVMDVFDVIMFVVFMDMNCLVLYGKVSVCVVYFLFDVFEVDIVVKDGLMLFLGLVFGDVLQYEMVFVGMYDFQVVLLLNGVVVFDFFGMMFFGGWIILVFVIGFVIGGLFGFSVLFVVDVVLFVCKFKLLFGGDVCCVG